MGAQLRAVRRRIRSIQSTAKITRAQELIASSRIIKAQQRLHSAAPYARELTRAVEAVVSRSGQIDHPLTRPGGQSEQGGSGHPDERPRLLRRIQLERAPRGAEPARPAARPAHRDGLVRGGPQGHQLAPVP